MDTFIRPGSVRLNTARRAVAARSPWVAWWLVRVRGYRIDFIGEHPRQGLFGRFGYNRTWWLLPPEAEGNQG